MTYVTLESGETKPKTKRAYVQPKYKAELEAYLARAAATEPFRRYSIFTGIILSAIYSILRNRTELSFELIYVIIAALYTLPYILYPYPKLPTLKIRGFKFTPRIVRTLAVLTFVIFNGWIISSLC